MSSLSNVNIINIKDLAKINDAFRNQVSFHCFGFPKCGLDDFS